jgi:hypothetical protein
VARVTLRWFSLCGARGVGPLFVGKRALVLFLWVLSLWIVCVGPLFVGPLLVGIHTYVKHWSSLCGDALGLS